MSTLNEKGEGLGGEAVCVAEHRDAGLAEDLVLSELGNFRCNVRVFDSAVGFRKVFTFDGDVLDRTFQPILHGADIASSA